MALDGITSFLRWKDVRNTCKCMRHSPTIGRISSVQLAESWKKLKASNVFCRLLCVTIEIDQL